MMYCMAMLFDYFMLKKVKGRVTSMPKHYEMKGYKASGCKHP